MGSSINKYLENNSKGVVVSSAVETFENEYPELSREFKQITLEMY